ncbi:MAG: secretion protein, partial [Alistipes sp.]|nr:secretion protein [Alistipes sp.]
MFLVGMTLMSSLVAGEAIASSGAGKVKPLNTKKWQKYDVGRIRFHDKAPQSEGSKIYHRLIAEPETYISEQARTVLATLYFSPKDSITPVRSIYYTLEDKE